MTARAVLTSSRPEDRQLLVDDLLGPGAVAADDPGLSASVVPWWE
jgi:hypothetical protein